MKKKKGKNNFKYLEDLKEADAILRYALRIPEINIDIRLSSRTADDFYIKLTKLCFYALDDVYINACNFDFLQNLYLYKSDHYDEMKDIFKDNNNSIIIAILYQHALISTYVKLRKIIGSLNPIGSYTAFDILQGGTNAFSRSVVNGALDYHVVSGFEYLQKKELKKKQWKLEPSKESIVFIRTNEEDLDREKLMTKCTEYKRQFFTVINLLDSHYINHTYLNLDGLSIDDFKKKNTDILTPDNVALFGYLKRNYQWLNAALNMPHDDQHIISWYRSYHNAVKRLLNTHVNLDAIYLTELDVFYLKYQLENLMDFEMIDCLFQCVKEYRSLLPQKYYYSIHECLRLPNLLSRQYMIQAAFFYLQTNWDAYESKPLLVQKKNTKIYESKYSHIINDPTNTVGDIRSREDYADLWMLCWESMNGYFSDFLFPVYENLFFISFYKYIRNSMKINDWDNSNRIILKMYEEISRFLTENAQLLKSEWVFNWTTQDDKLVLDPLSAFANTDQSSAEGEDAKLYYNLKKHQPKSEDEEIDEIVEELQIIEEERPIKTKRDFLSLSSIGIGAYPVISGIQRAYWEPYVTIEKDPKPDIL